MSLSTSNRPVTMPPRPARISSPDAARLIVRLWVPSAGSERSRPERPVRENLLLLTEDVIGVPCEPVNESGSLYSARMPSSTDALIASRQLQFAVEGFRRKLTAPVAVSLAIYADRAAGNSISEQNSPAGNGIAPLLSVIHSSRPAQILLTSEVCQQLSTIGGLPLRSSPARAGLQEYLWISAHELEKLQSEPALALLTTAPVLSDSYRARKVVDDSPEEGSGNTGKLFGTIWSRPAVAAVILLGLLAAAGAFVAMRHRVPTTSPGIEAGNASKRVPGPADHTLDSPGSQAGTDETKKVAQSTVAGGAALNPETVKALTNGREAKSSPLRDHVAHPGTTQEPHLQTQSPPSKIPTHCNLDGSLASWMTRANYWRTQGDYPHAIQLFQEILACDPKNATARQELNKLQAAVQESSDN